MQNKTSWDQGITVDSVQKFVETTCRYRDLWIGDGEYFDPWFRGQTRASKVLEPNIFRYRLLDSEDEIRAEFQKTRTTVHLRTGTRRLFGLVLPYAALWCSN